MTPTVPDVRRWSVADRRVIAAGLSAALVVRVGIVVATHGSYQAVNDAADFSRIAHAIASGHGFGSSTLTMTGHGAFRGPLWPTVLAGVYLFTGVSFTAGRLLLALIGTVLVGALAALAWRVAGRRAGLVTLYLAAIYPPLLLGGYSLNYEPLVGLLVVAILLCGLRWRDRPDRWRWLVVAGVLSGLAILCRENAGLILVPLWVMIVARRSGSRRAVVSRLVAVTGCAAIVVAPWTIRNAVQLHAFVPVTDSPGVALAGEYNPYTAAHVSRPSSFSFASAAPRPGAAESEQRIDVAAENSALRFIESHPSDVPKVFFWNAVHLFDLQGPASATWIAPYEPWPPRFIELSVVSFYVLAIAALVGLVTRRGRGIPRSVLLFPFVWGLSVVLTVSVNQYRFLIEPFVVLLAAIAMVSGFERRKHLAPDHPISQAVRPTVEGGEPGLG